MADKCDPLSPGDMMPLQQLFDILLKQGLMCSRLALNILSSDQWPLTVYPQASDFQVLELQAPAIILNSRSAIEPRVPEYKMSILPAELCH